MISHFFFIFPHAPFRYADTPQSFHAPSAPAILLFLKASCRADFLKRQTKKNLLCSHGIPLIPKQD